MAPKLSKHRVAANEDGHSLVSLNAPCCDRHWGTDFEDSESSYLFRKMDVLFAGVTEHGMQPVGTYLSRFWSVPRA